jgi:hypothetical protein
VKQYPRAKVRKPSADDLADAELLAACMKAAVKALRPVLKLNRDRFLRELQPHELQALAVAVLSEYIATRTLLEIRDELNDDISDVGAA